MDLREKVAFLCQDRGYKPYKHGYVYVMDPTKRLKIYFMNAKTVTKESLRQELVNQGVTGLLKITSLINKILTFLADSYNKFTAEGE